MRHALLGGIAGSILIRWAMSTTVYSLKLETDKKWCMISPFKSVNLEVAYLGIQGDTSNGNFEQRLLLLDLQSIHSPQSGKKIGTTTSPFVTSVTSSPTLSTTLDHIKMGLEFINGSYSIKLNVWTSRSNGANILSCRIS